MDKKLTLRLDQKVIEKAKHFAKKNGTSLSRMIEAYFESITNSKEEENKEITPLVESLCGIIELPMDFDYKSSRKKHLLEKHK